MHPSRVKRAVIIATLSIIATAFGGASASAGTVPADNPGVGIPYCPQLAPLNSEYLGSSTLGPRHIDHYKVPTRLGFSFVQVFCD